MTRDMRAVIFDLDGTLLDTLSDIARAMNTVLARHDLPAHETSAYGWMVGSGLHVLVERAIPEGLHADASFVATLADELREEYAAHPIVETRPYDGVADLLAGLAESNVPRAVLSNKADPLVQQIVTRLFAAGEFTAVQGMRPEVPPKPDPQSALDIAARLGTAPAQVVYLGDSDIDMQTARNAGMRAVGAGWGFRGAEELRAAGASVVLDHPGELLHLIDDNG